jgi:arylsulfatase A-like enzyme/Flp pilus assembly protein TadD
VTASSRITTANRVLLLVLALTGCGRPPSAPHVLLITIDTCRADRIGCYDAQADWTPVLDRLAGRGVTFTDATAPVPLTLPSHASILTGLYPDRHGVRDNGAARLPDDAETLAEILRSAGWNTAGFLAAVPLERRYGTAQGFDLYDDAFVQDPVAGDLLNRLYTDQRPADVVVDAALPWIRGAATGPDPFFAWIHFFDPHSPQQPPSHIAARVRSSPYDGEVAFVDEQIGRLLDGLGDVVERCVVLVTADHGESLGEHDESSHGFFVYDASMRVPWIMAGPDLPSGRRVDDPVSLVQIMPTLLDLLGLPIPDDLDGTSTLPLLAGERADPTPIYAESLFPRLNFGWSGSRSWRRGSWKYIEAPRPELYDLAQDPGETRNLMSERAEVAGELHRELRKFLARGGELGAVSLEVDEQTRLQLDALGYVGGDGVGHDDELWDFEARDPKEMIALYHDLNQLPGVVMESPKDQERAFVDALVAGDPENLSILERILRLRLRVDDDQGATETCRRIVEVDPEHAKGWKTLASLLADENDHAGAVWAYSEATRLLPSDGALASDHALSLESLGETDRAMDEYDRALELDPALPAAVNGKALLLSRSGRKREAASVLRAGLPHLADDLETINNLAWILADASIDPTEAYDLARRARELAPDDPAVLDTYGWAAIRSGRSAEAVAPLTEAWRVMRDDEVRGHLGVALAESGREEEGIAHVRAAIAARPELANIAELAKWNR